MLKRVTKEYKLGNINNFKTVYGTVNKNKPEVIYIKSKSKIKPKNEKNSYSDDVILLKENIIKFTNDLIKSNDVFKDNIIFTIDTTENGLTHKKSSHFKYDLYLMPKILMPLKNYECEIEKITTLINSEIENELNFASIENIVKK